MKVDLRTPIGGALAPEPKPKTDAQVAAKQLEAFFLRQLLAEARPQSAIDGGFAGETFKQMFDEAIADKMSAAGGVGLASIFASQLTTAASSTSAATPAMTEVAPLHRGPADMIPLPGSPHFVLPVVGRPTSGYGLRTDPIHGTTSNHKGFDLAAATGTQVSAAAGGTVVHAGPAGTYGNLVTLRHDNGFETRYAHLSAVDVAVGDRVEIGQGVGKVGSTGHSTGPHLHFEVRQDGVAIDPAPFIADRPLHSSPARTKR